MSNVANALPQRMVRNTRTRSIKVEIPNDDSAERVIRYVAKQLGDGQEVIVLDYSPVIPAEDMAVIVSQLNTYIKTQEAKYRARLFERNF